MEKTFKISANFYKIFQMHATSLIFINTKDMLLSINNYIQVQQVNLTTDQIVY